MKVIEVSKLLNLINHLKLPDVEQGTFPIAYYQQYALDSIKEMLTEESMVTEVNIVRCKDCKHWKETVNGVPTCQGHGIAFITQAEDYCSYGERKGKR